MKCSGIPNVRIPSMIVVPRRFPASSANPSGADIMWIIVVVGVTMPRASLLDEFPDFVFPARTILKLREGDTNEVAYLTFPFLNGLKIDLCVTRIWLSRIKSFKVDGIIFPCPFTTMTAVTFCPKTNKTDQVSFSYCKFRPLSMKMQLNLSNSRCKSQFGIQLFLKKNKRASSS